MQQMKHQPGQAHRPGQQRTWVRGVLGAGVALTLAIPLAMMSGATASPPADGAVAPPGARAGAAHGATAHGTSGWVSCSAAYSLTNSWSGGFQAQIVLTNTGTRPTSFAVNGTACTS